jgi:glucose-1-phosphate cytidylyltransferase
MYLAPDGTVVQFREKPLNDHYAYAGVFVFELEVRGYLDEKCFLEQATLEALAKNGQLMAYRHDGFW